MSTHSVVVLTPTLEGAGVGRCAVESPAEAIRLLENDDGVESVIHDYEVPPPNTAKAIAKTKAIRPDPVIAGMSGSHRRDGFAALGVEHYLQRPWLFDDLVNVLIGRIGNYGQRDLALPLRRSKPDEQARSWIFTNCGSRYRAVLDDTRADDVTGNARLTEQ